MFVQDILVETVVYISDFALKSYDVFLPILGIIVLSYLFHFIGAFIFLRK